LAGVAAGAGAAPAWLAFAASLLIFSVTVFFAPLCEARAQTRRGAKTMGLYIKAR